MRKTGQDGKYQNINYNENIPITLEYVWDLKNGMNAERSVAVVIMLKKKNKKKLEDRTYTLNSNTLDAATFLRLRDTTLTREQEALIICPVQYVVDCVLSSRPENNKLY